MVYTPQNSKGLKLVDCDGREIKYAFEFDDETQVGKFFVLNKVGDGKTKFKVENGKLATCELTIPGARMVAK